MSKSQSRRQGQVQNPGSHILEHPNSEESSIPTQRGQSQDTSGQGISSSQSDNITDAAKPGKSIQRSKQSKRVPNVPYPDPNCRLESSWLLVCVPHGHVLRSGVIDLHEIHTDCQLFVELRHKIDNLRGSMRSWLHPLQFNYCHVSKFEKFGVDQLGWICNEFPEDREYDYTPRPPSKPYQMPLSWTEWYARYYELDGCGDLDGMAHVPKRKESFPLSVCMKRENFWGLHVQLQRSVPHTVMWQVLLLLPSLLFFVFYTSLHHAVDWTVAVIPLTLTFGLCDFFWRSFPDQEKVL